MTDLQPAVAAAVAPLVPAEEIESDAQVDQARQQIKDWLNQPMRVSITDGRVLVGVLLCTDRDQNLILGSCNEYIGTPSEQEEFRVLGLALVPGHHIQSIHIDQTSPSDTRPSHSSSTSTYQNNDQAIDDDKSDGWEIYVFLVFESIRAFCVFLCWTIDLLSFFFVLIDFFPLFSDVVSTRKYAAITQTEISECQHFQEQSLRHESNDETNQCNGTQRRLRTLQRGSGMESTLPKVQTIDATEEMVPIDQRFRIFWTISSRLVFDVSNAMSFGPITSFVMIVVLKKISAVNVDSVKKQPSSKHGCPARWLLIADVRFRRPVPAVEEEREQVEFEADVKLLRERQRRRFIEINA